MSYWRGNFRLEDELKTLKAYPGYLRQSFAHVRVQMQPLLHLELCIAIAIDK